MFLRAGARIVFVLVIFQAVNPLLNVGRVDGHNGRYKCFRELAEANAEVVKVDGRTS